MKTSLLLPGHPTWIRLGLWLAAVALFSVSLSDVWAQDEIGSDEEANKGPLTLEYLIGNAVRISSNSKYPEIEKAVQRFKNGDGPGAYGYLQQAAEKYPKLPPTDIILAKMQLAARNGKAVRILLERATANSPDDPEAYLMLADQAFVGGRITEALALFEFAAPIVDKYSGNSFRKNLFEIRVIAGRAAVTERRQQWESAKVLLEQWLERDPKSSAAFQRLGVVMFNLDDTKSALQHFREARKLDKEKVSHPFVIMATLFAKQDNKLNARKAFERAYKEDKSDSQVAQAYAKWLIQEGELDDAKEVASTLRSQVPDSVAAPLLDAIISVMQGDRNSAQEALEDVLAKEISHADAMNMLALLLIESDSVSDRKKALQYAQMNAQRFPESGQANITFGWILYKLGRAAEAKTALQRGQQAGNPTANSNYLLARIAAEQDSEEQKKQAIQALEAILKNEKSLFLFQKEAEKLLENLKAEVE